MTNGSRTWRKRRRRCRARSRSACDQPQNLAGRKFWRSAGSHPACHCSSLSGLPTNCGAPFSTLPESLTSFTIRLRAHPSAFHSHFLSAHNTGTVFLKKILWITFSSVFLTMEPSQEPRFLSQMMMGLSSSLPLFVVPHTAPPTPPKSKRDWEDDSTAFLDGFVWGEVSCQQHEQLDTAAVARNFIEDWGGISIDPCVHLGSSSVQSTQNAEV